MPTMITEVQKEVEVEFEVWCGTCGAGLCRQTDVTGDSVEVDACDSCIREAELEAQSDAYSEGYDDGWDEGYKKGYEKALQELREEGLLPGLGTSGEKVCKPLCMSKEQ